MSASTLFRKLTLFLSAIALVLSLFSCISQKKLKYMQTPASDENVYLLHKKEIIRIKPNDELYIRVSSFDDVSYNFFSSQTSSNSMSFGTDASISLISYSVDDSGYIYFPIVGKIMVKELSIDEVTSKLSKLLSEYFNQPAVLVKIVNKKISVLGEVRLPGSYAYTKDNINILEALSLAGDITVNGNRKDVYVIRTVNDSIVKAKIDLTRDNLLINRNFYLKANDIVYVQARPSVKWSVISVPITLVLSSITTFILVFSYIQL
jgi:polysaccharide export outer membrane protein